RRVTRSGHATVPHPPLPPRLPLTLHELQLDQLRLAQRAAQSSPELRLQRADAVVAAALAFVNAVAREPSAQPLRAAPHVLSTARLRKRQRKPARRAVGHRHVEPPALAASFDRE